MKRAPGCRHLADAAWLLCVGPWLTVGAQEQADTGQRPVIQAVEIRRAPVFSAVEAQFWGFRLLNALHAETRPYVIRRELLISPGAPWDTALANESERNLRALGIFRDVQIDSVRTDSGLIARVRTVDAWTTSIGVGLTTSGSQYVLDLSLQELNLLGTRTGALLAYRNDPDRTAVGVGFDTPRALWGQVGVGASYVDRSDGRAAAVSLRQPFYSLVARRGGSLQAQYLDGRVLRYAGGTGSPVDSMRRRYELIRADGAFAATAGTRGFLRLGLLAQLRREDFGPEGGTAPIPRTLTGAAGPTLALRRPRFIRVRNVESTDRIEDIDLGLAVQADVLLAPSAWGYERTGVGGSLGVTLGQPLPMGFTRTRLNAGALQTADGTDSSVVEVAASLVLQPASQHLVVAFAGGGMRRNPAFGTEYDLGLSYGLRAYPAHAFTGDRHYLVSAEYRWLFLPRFLELLTVGGAVFADHGGAWFDGSPRRSGTDAGIGLRLSSIREAGGVWRLDLSRRSGDSAIEAGWVFSIGRGFVFGRV
jgi:hypothetical protein